MESEKKAKRVPSHRTAGLTKAARDLLSRVRASPGPELVFGLEPAAADAKARSVIDPLIEDTGLERGWAKRIDRGKRFPRR